MVSVFCIFASMLMLSSRYQVNLMDTDYLVTSWLESYLAFNLFDGKTNTCWAEGVSGDGSGTNGYMEWYKGVVRNRNGVGEQILISFDREVAVDKIRIYNGYMKNKEVWLKNRRVRKMAIQTAIPLKPLPANYQELSEEEYYKYFRYFSYEVDIPDIYQVFEIDLSRDKLTNISWFRFTILSTYPGTMYDDTCISEIEFWYQGQKYEVANLEQAKREFVRKRKERVLKILLGGPERREGYSFNWMFGLSYITFTRTGKENGEFFIEACIDARGAFVTNMKQVPDGSEMIITNIRGEWRFDEEGIFWTRVKGKDWKATDVSYIGENDLGRQGAVYFRGSDIETGYFNWSGPDADAGP